MWILDGETQISGVWTKKLSLKLFILHLWVQDLLKEVSPGGAQTLQESRTLPWSIEFVWDFNESSEKWESVETKWFAEGHVLLLPTITASSSKRFEKIHLLVNPRWGTLSSPTFVDKTRSRVWVFCLEIFNAAFFKPGCKAGRLDEVCSTQVWISGRDEWEYLHLLTLRCLFCFRTAKRAFTDVSWLTPSKSFWVFLQALLGHKFLILKFKMLGSPRF